MMITAIINFYFLILVFPGHSERSATFRDRRYRENHNSNFLLHQFDSAGPAGGGTRDSPHQKSCQRAAGGCGSGAQAVFVLHGLVLSSRHCSAQQLLRLPLRLELLPRAAFGGVKSWKSISCSWLMSARCRFCSTGGMFSVNSLCACLKSNENISVEAAVTQLCSALIQFIVAFQLSGRAWSRYSLFKVPASAFSKILQLLQEQKHFLFIN